jgi:hypothetical protein
MKVQKKNQKPESMKTKVDRLVRYGGDVNLLLPPQSLEKVLEISAYKTQCLYVLSTECTAK